MSGQGLYPVKDGSSGAAATAAFRGGIGRFRSVGPGPAGKVTLRTEATKMELRLVFKELRLNPPLGRPI